MAESKQARAERHKAILAGLNAPGGRERTNDEIAAEFGCSKRSVAYVRSCNPTPEQLERNMKALDSIFPGIYRMHREAQARKATAEDARVQSIVEIGEQTVKSVAEYHRPGNDGVNSPNFGRMTGEDWLKND